MKPCDCAFIGDVNPDIVLMGNSMPVLGKELLCDSLYLTMGGSTSISAAVFSSLGLKSCFFGRIGDDMLGRFTVDMLADCGVDTSGIKVCRGGYSSVTISFATSKDRALVTYPGTCGHIETSDIPVEEILRNARHIHIGSFFLQQHLVGVFREIFEAAQGSGVSTSLDAGWDPTEKWDPALFDVLRFTDIFFPNESEALAITGEGDVKSAALRMAEYCKIAVVKRGSKGSLLVSGAVYHECPIYDNYIGRDYTGAGDSYNAGFLLAFLNGMPLFDCMKYGSATAALRISTDRRTRPFATLDEVIAVVQKDIKEGEDNG